MSNNKKGTLKITDRDVEAYRTWLEKYNRYDEDTYQFGLSEWVAARDYYAMDTLYELHKSAELWSREAAKMVFDELERNELYPSKLKLAQWNAIKYRLTGE